MHVRMISIDALLLLDGLLNRDIAIYIFSLIESDPHSYFRYYVARALTSMVFIAPDCIPKQSQKLRKNDKGIDPRWENVREIVAENDVLASKIWKMLK